jgi:hypothetical protein
LPCEGEFRFLPFVTLNEAANECCLFQIQNWGSYVFHVSFFTNFACHFAVGGKFISDTNPLAAQLESISNPFLEMCNLTDPEYHGATAALTSCCLFLSQRNKTTLHKQGTLISPQVQVFTNVSASKVLKVALM